MSPIGIYTIINLACLLQELQSFVYGSREAFVYLDIVNLVVNHHFSED